MQLQEAHRWASNLAITFLCKRPGPFSYYPVYTKEELDKTPKWNFIIGLGTHGWLVSKPGIVLFPNCMCHAIREAHQGIHYGKEALYNRSVEVLVSPGMKSINILSWRAHLRNEQLQHQSPQKLPDKVHGNQGDISWRTLEV